MFARESPQRLAHAADMLLCVPPFIPFRCWPLWPPNGSTVYGSTMYPVLSARLCVVCVCRRPAAPSRSRAKRCSTAAQFSVLGQLHFVPRSESIAVSATQSPLPVSARSFSFPCILLHKRHNQSVSHIFCKPPAASIGSCRAFSLHSSFCSTHLGFAELSFLRFYLKYTFGSLLSGQGRRHGSVCRKEAEGGRCAGGPQ